jgi:hypothetical protein
MKIIIDVMCFIIIINYLSMIQLLRQTPKIATGIDIQARGQSEGKTRRGGLEKNIQNYTAD